MTAKYAEGTSVSPDRSQAEILGTLRKYGAQGFAFTLTLPVGWQDPQFRLDGRGYARTDTARKAAYDKEVARLWRCLALAIKAKLEVVSSGIATFEEEFLAHIVLPGGQTVGQHVLPRLDSADMPTSLLAIEAAGIVR